MGVTSLLQIRPAPTAQRAVYRDWARQQRYETADGVETPWAAGVSAHSVGPACYS
jgi:hypothetical protein